MLPLSHFEPSETKISSGSISAPRAAYSFVAIASLRKS
jgi:hypothetical protein